jgi:hypothetical protein
MAFLDSNLEFSDAQAVTAAAISTNVFDTAALRAGGGTDVAANIRQDLGNGEDDLWLCVTVNTAFSGGAATGMTVTFETADDAGLTTNATVLLTSGAILSAGLTAGTTLIQARIPSALYRRYIGVRYTPAGGSYGAGAVDAYLTMAPQANRIYKSGFTVQ